MRLMVDQLEIQQKEISMANNKLALYKAELPIASLPSKRRADESGRYDSPRISRELSRGSTDGPSRSSFYTQILSSSTSITLKSQPSSGPSLVQNYLPHDTLPLPAPGSPMWEDENRGLAQSSHACYGPKPYACFASICQSIRVCVSPILVHL
jgi:hypothetical protein